MFNCKMIIAYFVSSQVDLTDGELLKNFHGEKIREIFQILTLINHQLAIKNLAKSLCQLDLFMNIKKLVIIIFHLNSAVFFEHFKM